MKMSFALAVLIVSVAFITASATVINVPDDYPTIQEGINASFDGDTVLVAEGQYYERINFYGKGIFLTSEFIWDGDTLHIQNTIIDADTSEIGVTDTASVVCFVNGEDSNPVIQGFTIKNGIGTSISTYHRMGGGIYCSNNSSPTIINNIICDNSSSAGGGICCMVNSNPIIYNNTIRGNDGHGIYISESSPGIVNNTISLNCAEYGSGIYCNTNANATICHNIIRENYGCLWGGGILCRESNPLIAYNIIYENSAYDWGGGICCSEAYPTIIGNTISRNTALSNGGGVFCLNNASPTITNTIIWANSPREVGLRSGGSPIITYCDISNGWEGEGNIDIDPLFLSAYEGNFNICSQSPCIDAGDPSITDPDGSRSDIGFYFPDHPDCEIGKCLFVSTSGDDINGDGTQQNPFRTIQHGIDVSFSGDTVLIENGVYVENINLIAKNILLASNYLLSGDTLDIQNTIIDGDSDTTVVTFLSCDSTTAITGFTIRNGSGWFGGGIYCNYSDLTISNNIISGNLADASGGGIYCGFSNPVICHNTIVGNTADYGGGGIDLYYSDPTIGHNTINGNSAYQGGGISCNGYPIINRNVISDNSAHRGGGIYCFSTSPQIINNTLYGNSADSAGGIFCRYSPNPTITNTIFWADTALVACNEICIYNSSPEITYCDIQGGWEGEGNIDADPLFVDAGNSDFHLMAGSPCIDAGDPDSPFDPDGTIADIGAFYFDQSTGVVDDNLLPAEFYLEQNFPNPFNAQTTIKYDLPNTAQVTIDIYNILGRKVETLVNKTQPAGYHQVVWNADDVSSGIYFYKITAGDFSQSRKMILLK